MLQKVIYSTFEIRQCRCNVRIHLQQEPTSILKGRASRHCARISAIQNSFGSPFQLLRIVVVLCDVNEAKIIPQIVVTDMREHVEVVTHLCTKHLVSSMTKTEHFSSNTNLPLQHVRLVCFVLCYQSTQAVCVIFRLCHQNN